MKLSTDSKIKKLLIFGDSWPQGSELRSNQTPFGELLAQALDVPVMNFSLPSTSIPHLLLQLRQCISGTDRQKIFEIPGSDAVFFLTSPDRDLMWSQNGVKELHLNPNHPNDFDIRWYSQFHTDQLASFRVNSSLLAIHQFCAHYHIRDHYIWGWERIKLWPEIDLNRFWRNGESTVLDLFGENDKISFNGSIDDYCNNRSNRFVYPNSGHPNQRGHQLIAKELLNWLVTCT